MTKNAIDVYRISLLLPAIDLEEVTQKLWGITPEVLSRDYRRGPADSVQVRFDGNGIVRLNRSLSKRRDIHTEETPIERKSRYRMAYSDMSARLEGDYGENGQLLLRVHEGLNLYYTKNKGLVTIQWKDLPRGVASGYTESKALASLLTIAREPPYPHLIMNVLSERESIRYDFNYEGLDASSSSPTVVTVNMPLNTFLHHYNQKFSRIFEF